MGECGYYLNSTDNIIECYAIGWTILNRYEKNQGSISRIVINYYYGYNPSRMVTRNAIGVARLLNGIKDPTNGCIFALSNSDVRNLKIKIEPDYRTRTTQFWKEWPVGKIPPKPLAKHIMKKLEKLNVTF